MFHHEILWRGISYSVLMFLGKLVTGAWLVRLNPPSWKLAIPKVLRALVPTSCLDVTGKSSKKEAMAVELQQRRTQPMPIINGARDVATPPAIRDPPRTSAGTSRKPLSLYPATMLGTAMTARGEIGFLVASLAESNGLFADSDPRANQQNGSSELYLVVVWAIVLCTIAGPLGTGMLVKRVRKLQAERENVPARADPLEVWAIR